MSRRRWLSFALFALTALLSAAFGVAYLLSPRVMPYHQAALGVPWSELDPRTQVVLLALLRVAGGGFLTAAVAAALLLAHPFREGARWAPGAILAISLCMLLPAAYAVWIVATRTEGRPPWLAVAAGTALAVAGYAAAKLEGARRPAGLGLDSTAAGAQSSARPNNSFTRPASSGAAKT